jgi:signal transduction histidine kinase
VEREQFDVRTTISGVIESLSAMATEKRLSLTFESPPTAVMVTSDSKRLTQIMHNLVNNAVKYTAQGSVTVTLQDAPRQYTIIIKDTGMGITADDQKKLFTAFSRVGGVEDTTITGTGLGMWITRQLVELLEGSVSVESIKAVGTHVVIVFNH